MTKDLLGLMLAGALSMGGLGCESGSGGGGDGDADADSDMDADADSDADADGDGDLPCDGCSGDPCETNDDCLTGLTCNRINSSTAWCTNCTVLECESACTADINCGEGGACLGGICYHACASAADCPSGYTCYEGAACIPDDLPGLDEECAESSSFFCQPDPDEERTCVYTGSDPISDPGENWCTRVCATDNDCLDVFTLGCCQPAGDTMVCFRRDFCGADVSCTDDCPTHGDGECDDGGPGSLYDICALGTDCTDCGPR